MKGLNNWPKKVQCGFRPKRDTCDKLFVIIRQNIEKCYDHDIALHMLLMNFRQAFNSVGRIKLYEAMVCMGISLKLIMLMKMAMSFSKVKIKYEDMLNESLAFNKGVKSKVMSYRLLNYYATLSY